MIQHIQLKYILFLLLSFSFVKTEGEIELINGFYSNLINSEKEFLSFKVKSINNYSYLKIKAEGTGKTEKTNHIISYYQNQKFNERKQLSQSITDTSIMWLTNKQIEKDFDITIECAKFPCQYNLSLTGKDTAVLDLNEQYTYYVSDNNKEMNFRISFKEEIDDLDNYSIRIWIKGNFEINAELNGNKVDKKNYHLFDIEYNKFIDSEYDLIIRGDLINVGILLVKEDNKNYYFPLLQIEEGLEVTNYLNQQETNSYNISGYSSMFLGH